jgi:hypothetical protein
VASLYVWLKFLHIVGLAVFLLAHGVSAGASLVVRQPMAAAARKVILPISLRANFVAFPGLLIVIITGVWMGFLGSWWRMGWIWAAIVVLVLSIVAMSVMSVPYHRAREVLGEDKTAELDTRLKRARPIELAGIGAVALVILFFLMVFKPF